MEKVFDYNGCPVTFNTGENIMVNATEMAKPFGKSAKDWLRTQQAQAMISAIPTRQKCHVADLVKIINGGNQGNGTWMHEDVAMIFAQWLSPDFYLWCNDRIKELLTTGHTELEILILVNKKERSCNVAMV